MGFTALAVNERDRNLLLTLEEAFFMKHLEPKGLHVAFTGRWKEIDMGVRN